MTIELKEGMTLVCKTANGKTFKVGEKYPVIKSDNGDLYIKSEFARWFNDEMPYLEDNGDTFEVLPYTPDLSKLEEVECVADNQAAWSFVKGKKYQVQENINGGRFIVTGMNTRFYQNELEQLARTYGIRFDEPKPTQEPEPVTELKTGATLVCTNNANGRANYFTVGKKYPVIRATRFDGTSENCIESDDGTKWWNDEMDSLTNSGLVFQEYTGEQPKTLIPPHDRPYQAGDVLKMTGRRNYTHWTKDCEYQIYEDADGLYMIDDDYWDNGKWLATAQRRLTDSFRSNVLSSMTFVKHVEEPKLEQPEPEFNYTVKAANLKELNAVLYSAYQYTQTMLETNDKLEDYQREHDIAKENLEDLFK